MARKEALVEGRGRITTVRLEVNQVPDLPLPGAPYGTRASSDRAASPPRRMYAVATVTVRGGAGVTGAPPPAVVLLIDHSSSMATTAGRMAAARAAAVDALHALPDGCRFAIVAGRDRATTVYPPRGAAPAVADAAGRTAAEAALRGCHVGGGTAMGTWLERARTLFAQLPGGGAGFVRHALLVTDGRNEPGYESGDELEERLTACAPTAAFGFTCDAIGVGDAWETAELLLIARRMGGTARAVEEFAGLTELLPALARQAAGRHLPGLRLCLDPREDVTVLTAEQVYPDRRPMEPAGPGPRAPMHPGSQEPDAPGIGAEFPTAPWEDETRDYLFCLSAPYAGERPGEESMLAEVSLELDSVPAGAAGPPQAVPAPRPEVRSARPVELPEPLQILVRWTRDPVLYSRIDPAVGHYLHHGELAETWEQGRAALAAGDREGARKAFGRACRLAEKAGDDAMRDHLRKLVRVTDARSGAVELVDTIRSFDLKAADIRLSTTVRPR